MVTGKTLRIALVGVNQTPLDWRGNYARLSEGRARAAAEGARLICFPELAISGYGCEDGFFHPDVARRSLSLVVRLAAECPDQVILVGLPFHHQGKLYNGVAILEQGRIRAIVLKSHLARDGIHYEPRWFNPWPPGTTDTYDLDGELIPIGSLLFCLDGLSFALEICEDAWVAPHDRPACFLREAAWLFNCSASHFSMGKADIRESLVRESSRMFGVGYAYCNLVGCESGRAIYDGEQLIAEHGEIVNRSPRLYLDDVLTLPHDIHYQPREPLAHQLVLTCAPATHHQPLAQPTHRRAIIDVEEEMARAASLALLDYMRKSRARGFTLSLSGGVDSATVAVLVAIVARRLLTELSAADCARKLAHLPNIDWQHIDAQGLVGKLLTTVYQPTRNSGPVTRQAAAELAAALGARHLVLDVDEMVEGYKRAVSTAIGRELSWDRDDVALQNIQARGRGPSVWMLANLDGSLLLSTSNRSEVAVGYATMDGDTCGGLAPIAGVDKTFLRHWLTVMETTGLPGIPAIPILTLINNQAPTAELRPQSAGQTDEDDLMPYTVLDALEAVLIAQRRTPVEAYQTLCDRFGHQYTTATLHTWTKRFCRLFATSQWKRERYAPAFHLDDRNLDPKTWARYPILSGAFEQELADLDEFVANSASGS